MMLPVQFDCHYIFTVAHKPATNLKYTHKQVYLAGASILVLAKPSAALHFADDRIELSYVILIESSCNTSAAVQRTERMTGFWS